MGTDDPTERALHQGLIKLAAAYVHDVRGNPAGVRKNLLGAREHLARGQAAGGPALDAAGLDVERLLELIDERLDPGGAGLPPPALPASNRPTPPG